LKKKELNFDLKQLRSYLEILKENSFTRASRKLKIGQATISNHIQCLEEMLGIRLIIRTSKELSVTPKGVIFQAFCKKLFQDIENLKVGLGKGFGGVSSISASTIPSIYILPNIIASLKKDHPDFYYRVEVSDSREVVEKIKEGKTEIGVTGKQFKHASLVYEDFSSDEIVLIGPLDHPKSVNIQDLIKLPMISRENGSGTRDAYEMALKRYQILPSELNIVFENYTTDGVKESVISGIGVAFISRLAIERELCLKNLRIIAINGLKITRKFHVVYLKNRHLSEPAMELKNALHSNIE